MKPRLPRLDALTPVVRLNMLAVVAGLLGAIGSWLFTTLTDAVFFLFIEWPKHVLEGTGMEWLPFLISPAAGGILVGFLVHRYSPESRGHGIPEVMEALNVKDGKMPRRTPFLKILTSALTIGSGGSAGHEGPIAQVGAGFGSIIAQKLNIGGREMRTLVISGLAAGLSAIFNAPIGGALFAIEVVKRKTSMKLLGSIIIASVIGTFFGQLFLGRQYTFSGFPPIEYAHPELILFCIIGGMTSGLVSAAWIKFFYKMDDIQKGLFNRTRISPVFQPAIGGLVVGIFLVMLFLAFGDSWQDYTIMGVTYQPIKDVFTGITTAGTPLVLISIFLVLIVVKAVATSLTLGSGGSGGVFAPTLFIGVFLGAVFGILADMMFDFPVSAVPLFAMLGMAGFFAGTFRAPFTAVIMTAEITGNYFLTIPLLFAVVSSTLVSWRLEPDDIYIKKLLRRGIHIGDDTLFDVLDAVPVSQVMKATNDIPRVDASDSISSARALVETSLDTGIAVFDGTQFAGILTRADVMVVDNGTKDVAGVRVKTVMNARGSKPLICITCNATLSHAEAIMAFYDVSKLPVAKKDNQGKPVLLGWITNREIRAAYAKQHKAFDSADFNQYMLVF